MRIRFKEYRGLIVFLVLLGLFRTGIADWNTIPSSSMHPNLVEGDVVLVNRVAYDLKIPLTDVIVKRLGEPKRGDIVTFSRPGDSMRLIKRIVALPGDTVEMRNKQLLVNGKQAYYLRKGVHPELGDETGSEPVLQLREQVGGVDYDIQWHRDTPSASNFGPVSIPPEHYLMLGDNRDRSGDSRFFGLVSRANLIGRAERLLISVAYQDDWSPRFGRFGKSLAASQ